MSSPFLSAVSPTTPDIPTDLIDQLALRIARRADELARQDHPSNPARNYWIEAEEEILATAD